MEPRRFGIRLRRSYIETPGEPREEPDVMTRTHVLRRQVAARIPNFGASLEWLLPARFAGLVADLHLLPLLSDRGRASDDGLGAMPYREFSHAMAEGGAARRLRPDDGPARGALLTRWMLFAYAPQTCVDEISLGLWGADPVRGAQVNWLPIGTISRPLRELRASAGERGSGQSLVLRPEFATKL